MSLIQKLLGRNYEFDAELKNHQLGDQNIYRLYFISYYRIGEKYGRGHNNIGVTDWPFKPFMLPEGMNRSDAFKVLSYLSDFIEKEANLKPCSYKSVATLDSVIDLERLGFKRLNIKLENDSPKVIDLFTVTGRLLLFKKSKQYQKYFDWYTDGITFDEVKNIYKKCGIEFYDLVQVEKNKKEIENFEHESQTTDDKYNESKSMRNNSSRIISLEESLDMYLEQFKILAKENPDKAKKIAFESLFGSGIIDETGALKPPYNGEKVNDSDFTRGPQLVKKKEK